MIFGASFLDLLAWASAQPHEWLDVCRALHMSEYSSVVSELHLFDGAHRARALALLDLDDPLSANRRESPRPLHDGFLTMLELAPGNGDARGAVEALLAETPDVEQRLRDCYGNADGLEHDLRFFAIDYPTFAKRPLRVGFGVMIENTYPTSDARRWLWSRAVLAHK